MNNIINIVKSHLSQYNFIEIDFKIQDNILLINLHPRYQFIEFNDEIIDLIKLIEAELQEKNETGYNIIVYNTLNNYINR